ncbi:hypothetical protein [Salinirubrum litoreum]|uniref:Uncharacterized protein n=1 Tax=Salinirubrum litoreum TaxID=1126234 RepID=A0ABD5R988_9EURY|nr:hypothetical protein [Salinirubrum litoreum]
MLDRLRAWLHGLFGGTAETDESDDDDSQFVPSPLDRSVRRAHGSGDEEAGRELGRVGEQARQLEETSRRD